MADDIAKQWLQDAATTANNKDLEAHMDLISKRVNLTGVPGFESIGFAQWYQQCKHEFENNILKQIRFEGLKPVAVTATRVMFKTYEVVEGTRGEVNAQGMEILLEKEPDQKWRLVQERVLSREEGKYVSKQ